MEEVIIEQLGLIDYKSAWDYQEKLNQGIAQYKLKTRKGERVEGPQPLHRLLFCEHPLVFTLGKSGSKENLLINHSALQEKGIEFYKINRGGDITHHGPGQLVMYPIFDLEKFFTDIHKYLRLLEEAVILTLGEYGIVADRFPGYTGVWIDKDDPLKARKICAMGIRCTRWVTMHGIALNINNDLSPFEYIVPCGIEGKQVSSMSKELGNKVDFEGVRQRLLTKMEDLFNFRSVNSEQ